MNGFILENTRHHTLTIKRSLEDVLAQPRMKAMKCASGLCNRMVKSSHEEPYVVLPQQKPRHIMKLKQPREPPWMQQSGQGGGDSIREGPLETVHRTPPLVTRSEEDADGFEDADEVFDFDPDTFTPYQDDVEAPATVPEADIIDSTGKPVNQQSTADLLINAEVLLPQGEKDMMAKVVRRVVDENGKAIGTYNENPISLQMIQWLSLSRSL